MTAPGHRLNWAAVYRRTVDLVCFLTLILVMGLVIYGLFRRAAFETSYYAATVVAVIAALLLLISLAQQYIAARDAETWQILAEWQVRAAERDEDRPRSGIDDQDDDSDESGSPAIDRENMIKALATSIRTGDRKGAMP